MSWTSSPDLFVDALSCPQLAGLLAASGMSDIAIHPPIGRALCSAVHETIAAAYPAVAPTEDAPATTSAIARKPSPYLPPSDRDDGPVPSLSATCARVRPLLSLLGVHLCNDVKLFVRLCRIVGAVLNPPKQEASSPTTHHATLYSVPCTYSFPFAGCFPCRQYGCERRRR